MQPVRQLLRWDEAGRLEVCEDAAAALGALPRFRAVAIAGPFRTGKSFILNQLAGQPNGFQLGSTVEACTQGVWCWVVDGADGAPLVLLDTEGLFDPNRSAKHDVTTLCLSMLLSSVFVLNTVGRIDAESIDKLAIIVELSDKLQPRADTDDGADLDRCLPKLVWVLRDFCLRMECDGQEVTEAQYLERMLSPTTQTGKQHRDRNEIKDVVRRFFTRRSLHCLPCPLPHELLQDVEAHLDKLGPEFTARLQGLMAELGACDFFKLGGCEISGAAYVGWINSLVAGVNNGAIPAISSMVESLTASVNQCALQAALAGHRAALAAAFDEGVPLDVQAVLAAHADAHAAALAAFAAAKMGQAGDEFRRLEQLLQERLDAVLRDNEALSHRFNGELLAREFEAVDGRLQAGDFFPPAGGYAELLAAMHQGREAYELQARGPTIATDLAAFMEQRQVQIELVREADVRLSEQMKQQQAMAMEAERLAQEAEAARLAAEAETQKRLQVQETVQATLRAETEALQRDYAVRLQEMQICADARERAAREEAARGNESQARLMQEMSTMMREQIAAAQEQQKTAISALENSHREQRQTLTAQLEQSRAAERQAREQAAAAAADRGSGGGCFAASAAVTLFDGSVKPLPAVRIGDQLLGVRDGAPVPAEVYYHGANAGSRDTALLRVVTRACGGGAGDLALPGVLELTPDHMVVLADGALAPARALRPGHELLRLSVGGAPGAPGAPARARVVAVTPTSGPTYFALTSAGTLVVNSVVCGDWSEGDPVALFPLLRAVPRRVRESGVAVAVTRGVELAYRALRAALEAADPKAVPSEPCGNR